MVYIEWFCQFCSFFNVVFPNFFIRTELLHWVLISVFFLFSSSLLSSRKLTFFFFFLVFFNDAVGPILFSLYIFNFCLWYSSHYGKFSVLLGGGPNFCWLSGILFSSLFSSLLVLEGSGCFSVNSHNLTFFSPILLLGLGQIQVLTID